MRDPGFAKFVLFVNGSLPIALLLTDAYNQNLGASPTNHAIHTTGVVALIFLLLTLTITPLRKLTGWNWLSHFRRMLGLFAFFYASVHLSIYIVGERSFNLVAVWYDVARRPFILFGMTAWATMVPLALTSTNASIKRMGAVNWKNLHKLVYLSAVAAVAHYLKFGKVYTAAPIAFAVILTLLLGYRILTGLTRSRSARPVSIPRA